MNLTLPRFMNFRSKKYSYRVFIGGHGFWDKGGVYTGVCLKKKFAAAFGGQFFFPPGCENFFSVGGFISRHGCDFAKK